ncbi:MAG: hypothetical protein JXA30_12065 [Deltaproteobacteria bacterium]|nr:hypothetical protein [Deltaproteobacteria bacterium]
MNIIESNKTGRRFRPIAGIIALIIALGVCIDSEPVTAKSSVSAYQQWEALGEAAARESFALLKNIGAKPGKGNMLVLTNAGYAEIDGASTQGALDGLAQITGASRGKNSLLEIHASAGDPLWFAIFDKVSGFCVYLEVDPQVAASWADISGRLPSNTYQKRAVERIDFAYLTAHGSETKSKFEQKVFSGNEFRIVSIANAVAAGAPTRAVRAFEFHDHYCPGVTSGVLMAEYLNKNFAPQVGGRTFVYAVEPWCKEDALLVLLNATPGKRAYAATFPTDADKNRRLPQAKDACTVVYRQVGKSEKWEGIVLSFQWGETGCPQTENKLLDKVCADLWYLERMDRPEDFVKVIKTFKLPDGVAPQDWARPGVDPMERLGLLQPTRRKATKPKVK